MVWAHEVYYPFALMMRFCGESECDSTSSVVEVGSGEANEKASATPGAKAAQELKTVIALDPETVASSGEAPGGGTTMHGTQQEGDYDFDDECSHFDYVTEAHSGKHGPIGPGLTIIPFSITLPLGLPASTNFPDDTGGNTKYGLIATAQRRGQGDDGEIQPSVSCGIFVEVRSPMPFLYPRIPVSFLPSSNFESFQVPANAPDFDGRDFAWRIDGPSQIWCGEPYSFNCKIVNLKGAAITGFEVVLLKTGWLAGRREDSTGPRSGAWERQPTRLPEVHLVFAPHCASLRDAFPGPTEGTTWAGAVTVIVPPGLDPSVHISTSPLVQLSYSWGIRLFSPIIPPASYYVSKSQSIFEFPMPVTLMDASGRPPADQVMEALPAFLQSITNAPSADTVTLDPFRPADNPNSDFAKIGLHATTGPFRSWARLNYQPSAAALAGFAPKLDRTTPFFLSSNLDSVFKGLPSPNAVDSVRAPPDTNNVKWNYGLTPAWIMNYRRFPPSPQDLYYSDAQMWDALQSAQKPPPPNPQQVIAHQTVIQQTTIQQTILQPVQQFIAYETQQPPQQMPLQPHQPQQMPYMSQQLPQQAQYPDAAGQPQ